MDTEDLYYDLSKKILIKVFIHKTYENKKKRGIDDRVGTDYDVSRLKNCFGKMFNIQPEILWDLSKEKIIKQLDEGNE